MCIVSIAKEVLGRSMAKFSIFIRWSLPITFRLSFFNSNPECSSSMLRRLMAALIESFCNAFREMFAIMLRKRRCCGLNFPGVSFSDSTSYETFPRRISKELIRRSRLFSFEPYLWMRMRRVQTKIRFILWSLLAQIDVKAEQLYVTDGYFAAE